MMVPFGGVLFFPRLRLLGHARNHSSPVDFIIDRFRSNTLRYAVVALQLVPCWIYLSAQVSALKSTLNVGVFGVDANDPWITYAPSARECGRAECAGGRARVQRGG